MVVGEMQYFMIFGLFNMNEMLKYPMRKYEIYH